MNKIISNDGTSISFQQTGKGPLVILVASALSDRSDTVKLAKLLSQHFTVINYDRRGRGKSNDTKPYTIQKEVEDIDGLISCTAESAFLFGSSSGAVLALDAANALPEKIKKIALYEPPFIINDKRPPMADDLSVQIEKLLSEDRKNDAVKLFMSQTMNIPAIGLWIMQLIPGWKKMKDMAHTIPYDLALLNGTQSGKPLPESRWNAIQAPALIMTGGKSEEFFHTGATALATMLINGQHNILKGQHHGSVVMSPKLIATRVIDFFIG